MKHALGRMIDHCGTCCEYPELAAHALIEDQERKLQLDTEDRAGG